MKAFLPACVKTYQYLTFSRPACCRFYPSCSEYAKIVISEHTRTRALYLIVRRLLRCTPWHQGGIDLPPPSTQGELC